jgi:hypothetical protein
MLSFSQKGANPYFFKEDFQNGLVFKTKKPQSADGVQPITEAAGDFSG